MKISKKYYNIVFSCLAATIISIPISFVMVAINLGFVAGFFLAFVKSALASVAISLPLTNVGIPLAKKLADRIVAE